MRWISASQLEVWAKSIGSSRSELAKVVSDLISATAQDINAIRFPSGDKGQVRGFDGHLESASEALNVPAGRSYWELGTEENYKKKADEEFEKRTQQVSTEDRCDSTFVFVSPWTWDSSKHDKKIEDWIAKHKEGSGWKDVRYIDGSMLETWFDHCPAAAAWHAKYTLRVSPPQDVHSAEEFWQDFTGRFGPPLTEPVLLCERDNHAKEVRRTFMQPNGMVKLVADSPDEVVAFAIAAIRTADPLERLFLEARTLVVDSVAAGRQLAGNRRLVLLLRNDAARSPAQFSDLGPLLVPLSRAQRGSPAEILNRPTGYALGKAMVSMGLAETRAITLARGCGRSLTVLARLIPGGSHNESPKWEMHASSLLPAILAGGWDSRRALDVQILEQIAGGTPYSELERQIRICLNQPDPPFDLEGTVWKVRAPMDAFMRIGDLIAAGDAETLYKAMIAVFSTVEPDVNPDDAFGTYRAAASGHSEWLREGLATTLLLLAAWSVPARVNLGQESGQAFANRVVTNLPGLMGDHRLLSSLKEELPLLAEAAPFPLLSALEQLLEGQAERIRPIFNEQPGWVFPVSKHVGLLFALETLAWEPEHFLQAVMILARLTEIDPGGRLGNRPGKSLQDIFILWNPQTSASPQLRLAALDAILENHPQVGWKLLMSLLPSSLGSVSTPTAKPRLREAGAADRKPMTYRELGEIESAVMQRAIRQAADGVDRWLELIPTLGNFVPDARNDAIATLDHLLTSLPEPNQKRLWSKVRDEVSRHERFNSAPWALKADALDPLQALVKRHAPADPVVQRMWLFDTWDVDNAGELEVSSQRRATLLKEIIAIGDIDDVLRLGTDAKMPHLVVQAISDAQLDEPVIRALLEKSFDLDPASLFTWGLVALHRQVAGVERARDWLALLRNSGRLSEALTAQLLLAWPDELASWRVVRHFGAAVEISYWKQRPARYPIGGRASLIRAQLMLLKVGRASIALESAANRRAEVPTPLMLRLLDGIISEVNSRNRAPDTMLTFHVERALEAIEGRPDISVGEVAQREYSLLPLLQFSKRRLRIHELMASDPAFYHQLLREVFRGKSEPKVEVDASTQARATLAYSLLSNFDRLPGTHETVIDAVVLTGWIDEVRKLGLSTDRAEITDDFVGKILAHAPKDSDGVWPHRAVREQIERLRSEVIERAIKMERYNMRGVHHKGLYDGGNQERELARTHHLDAELTSTWPRTSNLLNTIARKWEADAEREDIEAGQRKLNS